MKKLAGITRKKSNTAAIVAAVLVATLSLFVNQLVRITPEKVDVMMGTLQSLKTISREMVSSVSGDDSAGPEGVVLRTPKQIITDLQQLKDKLDVFFAAYVRSGIPEEEKLKPFLRVVGKASSALESQREGVPSDQLIRGRMLVFQCFFLAAGILPDAYSTDFVAASERLLSDPNFDHADAIRVYQALNDLRLYSCTERVVLQKLGDFSMKHPDDALAIKLYLLLANAMEKSGRRELSRLILRQGMDIYRNHQERPQLVNRLLDLSFEGRSNGNR